MRTMNQWLPTGILIACSVVAMTPVAAMADPVISGFNQTSVPLGSFLTIQGSGFGDAMGKSYVLVGGRQVPVLAWSSGSIYALVNPLAFSPGALALDAAYPVRVVVPVATTPNSNTVNLTITSDPLVTGFLGTNFKSGNAIRIYGARFGAIQGAGNLTITVAGLNANGVPFTQAIPVMVMAWSDNTIDGMLSLPAGAQLGAYNLTVHRSDGVTSSNSFTLIAG
jgi:IPT/TIG domain